MPDVAHPQEAAHGGPQAERLCSACGLSLAHTWRSVDVIAFGKLLTYHSVRTGFKWGFITGVAVSLAAFWLAKYLIFLGA
jgi:hypothetical protein